jgi:cell division protein FtsQ
MKKTGSKRGLAYDSGLGSTVLEAPEESYGRESEARSPWQGRGPAPAGALHRGYGGDEYEGASGYGASDEPEYVPKRGKKTKLRFKGLPGTVAGRIVMGVVAFGLVATIVIAIVGMRHYLLHDPRFVVGSSDEIQVDGAEHLTRSQVLSVFGADLERNIFRMSLEERKGDLERLPWVAHATVMRLLPNNVRVQIKERTPVAFVRQGSQIGLVDANGVLLDMPPETAGDPQYSFPVLTGLSAEMPLDTRAARMDVYGQFMKELRSADAHLTDSLSEVDVSDPEDVKALIASGSSDVLVHFGNEDFLKRYRQFEEHLPEWKQQYPKLASADMRYDGQIVLEMQGEKSGSTSVDAGTGLAAAPVAEKAEARAATVKPAELKLAGADSAKPVAAKVAGPKPVAVKPAVAKAAAPKPASAKAGVGNTVAVNSAAVNPFAGPAPKPAAAPVAVSLNGPVVKASAAKPAAAPKVEAKKVVAKKTGAKGAAGSGTDSANEKVFAALAAAHRAELAKEAKSGAKPAGGVTQ